MLTPEMPRQLKLDAAFWTSSSVDQIQRQVYGTLLTNDSGLCSGHTMYRLSRLSGRNPRDM